MWIPAFAGMTRMKSGMTRIKLGMTGVKAGTRVLRHPRQGGEQSLIYFREVRGHDPGALQQACVFDVILCVPKGYEHS